MQNFELTILGCSSATPTSKRNPSSQLLNIADRYFLIDCGEATQIQLRKYKIKFQRINHIFISHLHGDHYLGLMGLLSSMHLLGRVTDLHLFCPKELKDIIDIQLNVSQTQLRYKIIYNFHKYINDDLIYEDDKVAVKTVVLSHRIPCCGFVFTEKPLPSNISKETIEKYKIPFDQIHLIKNGEDLTLPNGETIPNNLLVLPKPNQRSYAYCSDTIYDESIVKTINNVDLLYHEATFLHELIDRAKETFHTTALQAATIALKANVNQLIIGHYSARYKDLQPLLDEAKSVFNNTILAVEGNTISL